MPNHSFTATELAQYDGKNGKAAYIAFRGKVYDVSDSYFWRGGVHWAEHTAGHDLTAEIDDAPHSPETLDRFPIVGNLVSKK